MMHGVRGFFRFAHIDGLVVADPAVYARLPKINSDESRTQGLERLELIRFLQVAQTLSVHHGALTYLFGINVLRASEALDLRSRLGRGRCHQVGRRCDGVDRGSGRPRTLQRGSGAALVEKVATCWVQTRLRRWTRGRVMG